MVANDASSALCGATAFNLTIIDDVLADLNIMFKWFEARPLPVRFSMHSLRL